MLSTISSFLPSVLSDKLEKIDLHGEQPGHTQQNSDDEGVIRRDMAEGGNKKEKKKRSASNETFIVVRPPPAKSNHPLNLQLQLVPAQHTRDRSNTSAAATPTNSRFSADFTQGNEPTSAAAQPPPSPAASSETDHQSNGLRRSESTRSNRSEASGFYSSATSAGSVTSFASTASNASSRRMIIPLYNLSAHNVMTNTILDAGTDAKVAKFLKRGIEIIGLAILEPTEVWNGPAGPNSTGPLGVPMHRSTSGNSLAPPGQGGSRSATPDPQHSPGSSHLSLSSEHSSAAGHAADFAPSPSTAAPSHTGAKRIFGRIFRKKEGSGGGGHTPTPSISGLTPVLEPVVPPTPMPEVRTPTMPAAAPRPEIVLPPVLGLSPTLTATSNPPSGRCVAHVWTVRRWLKTDNQGLISGVIGKISREVSSHGYGGMPESSEWEVRFEWARGRSKGEKARKLARRASLDVEGRRQRSHTPSRRNSALVQVEEAGGVAVVESPRESLDVAHPRPGGRAPSPRRPPAAAADKATSVASTSPSDDEGAPSATGDDPGDESDPEDSETPWTCTLVLTHPSHPIAAQVASHVKSHSRRRTISSSGGIVVSAADPAPLRLKIATLAPAPHHPKVVCQLKVPFPLPDVEVDHGVLRKRLVVADGSTRSTVPRERSGLIMTAEEIKDVVCSTAFWVVVRQGFGGLGKKNRKGDGWKIRG